MNTPLKKSEQQKARAKNSFHPACWILTTAVCLLCFCSFAQKNKADNFLEGKTFIIELYDYNPEGKKTGTPVRDEITFVGGKLSSKLMNKEYMFSPGNYSTKADSSKGNSTILFVAENKNPENGNTLFWMGSITGDTIERTMKWFAQPMTKTFTGTLKYKDEEK